MGVLDLPAKINSFYREAPEAKGHIGEQLWGYSYFNGNWSNDEDVREVNNFAGDPSAYTETPDQGSLQLAIEVDNSDGSFHGEVFAETLGKTYVYSRVMIEGEIGTGGAEAHAWDYVHGKKSTLATIRLTRTTYRGSPALRFEVRKQMSQYFPAQAVLWQSEFEMRDGSFNPKWVGSLQQSSKKVLEERKSAGQLQRSE